MSDCRGCSGTCCTGLGSEPCTCPEPAVTETPDWYTPELAALYPRESLIPPTEPGGLAVLIPGAERYVRPATQRRITDRQHARDYTEERAELARGEGSW